MLTAQELKKGTFIEYENGVHQIMDCQYHRGQGKMGNFVHLKIKDVNSGRVHEINMQPQDKVDEAEVERRTMKYLYEDASGLCFMDPSNYEQVVVNPDMVGTDKAYLNEDMEVEIALYNGVPIHVSMPDRIVLEITSTGEGVKGDTDNVYKPATLSNNMEVLVPHFLKTGDKIVVDIETGKYVERAK